jgi:hypothetical protein
MSLSLSFSCAKNTYTQEKRNKKQEKVGRKNIHGSQGWPQELLSSPPPFHPPTSTISQRGRNEISNLLIYSQKP